MQTFKIYGVFRSGTNLLKLLIEQNMDAECRFSIGGHKHLYSPMNFGPDGYIVPDEKALVCVKDPYASMASLFRYAKLVKVRHFDCGRSWETFLTSRFVVSIDQAPYPPSFWFRSPIDYWTSHYFHMASLPAERAIIVRYEDVLADPYAVLERIARHFPGTMMTSQSVALPANAMARMREKLADKPVTDRPFDIGWYNLRQYMREFSAPQLAEMRGALDTDLMDRLGYVIA